MTTSMAKPTEPQPEHQGLAPAEPAVVPESGAVASESAAGESVEPIDEPIEPAGPQDRGPDDVEVGRAADEPQPLKTLGPPQTLKSLEPSAPVAPRPTGDTTTGDAPPQPAPTPPTGWARLRAAGVGRPTRGQILIGVLCGALGFAAVTQVRLSQDDLLAQADRSDLVQILDGLTQRGQVLQEQIADLEESRRELTSSADQGQTALQQARQRAYELGVLAGTQEATGPGVVITMTDPESLFDPTLMLGAVQELRDAGAEAIQIVGRGGSEVRVVASTWFAGSDGELVVDGTTMEGPFTITAIGDPGTLGPAMSIPGGVVATVKDTGGRARVEQEDSVTVDVVRAPSPPTYASPAPEED